jgi:hypothetical protein
MPEPEEGPSRTPTGGHLPNCGLLERNTTGGTAPQPVGERSVNLAKVGHGLVADCSEAAPYKIDRKSNKKNCASCNNLIYTSSQKKKKELTTFPKKTPGKYFFGGGFFFRMDFWIFFFRFFGCVG